MSDPQSSSEPTEQGRQTSQSRGSGPSDAPRGTTDTTSVGTEGRATSNGPTASSSGDGLTDVLTQPTVKSQLKAAWAYFAVVGAGIGVTGFLALDQVVGVVTGGNGIIASAIGSVLTALLALVVVTTTLVLGPVVAAVVATRLSETLRHRDSGAYAVGFVGSYVGAVLMVVVAAALTSLGLPGGGSGGSGGGSSLELGRLLVPILVTGVPSGIVGAATVYLERRLPIGRPDGPSALDDSGRAKRTTDG